MDAVTLALAKKYTDSQRIGGVTKNKVTVDYVDLNSNDLTVMGISFTRISPLTPTKDELAKGNIYTTAHIEDEGEHQTNLSVHTVLFDDDMVYGVQLALKENIPITHYFAVAYKAGEWAAGGVTITEPGIYMFALAEANPDEAIKRGMHSFSFEWETIHPIDPKFLPGVCLPVEIYLADYGIDLRGVVSTAVESGVHSTHFDGGVKLWEHLNTNARIRIKTMADFMGFDTWVEVCGQVYTTAGKLAQVTAKNHLLFGNQIIDISLCFCPINNSSTGEIVGTSVYVTTSVINLPAT